MGAGGLLPHPGPVGVGRRLPSRSGALRAAIFGVNDGLVSNLSLIMGVTGAGVSNRVILLAGIAGLLAGAFSMGAGEYISMRVQREVFERLIHDEAHELATDPEGEVEEQAFGGPLPPGE
jgi:VIT1/CCC1 family predicted Fe2+/Mn2+ transporter